METFSTRWHKSRHDNSTSEANGSYNCRPRVCFFAGYGIVQDFLKDFPRVMSSKKSLVALCYQTPGSLARESKRPSSSNVGGIRSSHAHSNNGEDPHAPPLKRRTAGKWDTQQS